MNSTEICKHFNIWVYDYGETLFNSLIWRCTEMMSLACDEVHHNLIGNRSYGSSLDYGDLGRWEREEEKDGKSGES